MSVPRVDKIGSAIMSSPQRFRVAIHRAKGCYFAHVIDLPGCVARGASEVEAVENARAAIAEFVQSGLMEQRGDFAFLTSRGRLLSNEVFERFILVDEIAR